MIGLLIANLVVSTLVLLLLLTVGIAAVVGSRKKKAQLQQLSTALSRQAQGGSTNPLLDLLNARSSG